MVVVDNNKLFFLGWCLAPKSVGETPSKKNRPLGVSVGPLDRIAAHVICRSRGNNGHCSEGFPRNLHPGAFLKNKNMRP